jgi:hypothetical protein
MLKYLVLAGVALWFTGTIDPRLASADPLVTAFGRQRGGAATFWIAGLLLLSIFYGRFWCRALCPAGAFLALLNGVRLLPRLRPSVVARRCVFGVSDGRDLDCICCDRCRLTSTEEQAALDAAESRGAAGAWGRAFLALSVGLALLLFVQSVAERRWDRKGPVPAQARAAPGSEMRQVDEQRLRARIEQGTLSDRGAMHYVPVSDPAP